MPSDDAADPIDPPLDISDAQTMRGLAHPVRLALMEVLILRGPVTATQASSLIDETPTTCSFHLRQLAKYGLVEEDGRGPGRTRRWRARHLGWQASPDSDDAKSQIASDALSSAALHRQVIRHQNARALRDTEQAPWTDVGGQMETVWWVTHEEYLALEAEVEALVDRFQERLSDPARRPPGVRPVEFSAFMHLFGQLENDDVHHGH